jgi:hypothetical protein
MTVAGGGTAAVRGKPARGCSKRRAQDSNESLAITPEDRDMSLMRELLEKPPSLSAASKWAAMNGFIYLGLGALFVVWPGAVQTIFMDGPFTGREKALFRVIGMTVMVIGWLYLFGGRSGSRQVVAASVLDRWILVPVVLVPIAIAGVFPHALLAFALLDASLALGAWVLRRRQT